MINPYAMFFLPVRLFQIRMVFPHQLCSHMLDLHQLHNHHIRIHQQGLLKPVAHGLNGLHRIVGTFRRRLQYHCNVRKLRQGRFFVGGDQNNRNTFGLYPLCLYDISLCLSRS